MGQIKMKVFLSVLTLAAVYAVADVDEAAPNTSQEEVSEASPSQQDSVLDWLCSPKVLLNSLNLS